MSKTESNGFPTTAEWVAGLSDDDLIRMYRRTLAAASSQSTGTQYVWPLGVTMTYVDMASAGQAELKRRGLEAPAR